MMGKGDMLLLDVERERDRQTDRQTDRRKGEIDGERERK